MRPAAPSRGRGAAAPAEPEAKPSGSSSSDDQRATYSWVQNAAQLSSYYTATRQYHHAERCLAAASAVCPAEPLPADSRDADVPANLAIAWGRLLLVRLKQSAGVDEDYDHDDADADEAEGGGARESAGPDFGPALPLPPPEELALARDWAAALGLFNRAMPHFRAALRHYVLDGFVSEHFNLLLVRPSPSQPARWRRDRPGFRRPHMRPPPTMPVLLVPPLPTPPSSSRCCLQDLSALHKNLATFEPDPHRRCVMHKRAPPSLLPGSLPRFGRRIGRGGACCLPPAEMLYVP